MTTPRFAPLPTLTIPEFASDSAKALHATAVELLGKANTSRAAVDKACQRAAEADLCSFKPVQVDHLRLAQEELRARTAADAYFTAIYAEIRAFNNRLRGTVETKRTEIVERLRTIGFDEPEGLSSVVSVHPEVIAAEQRAEADIFFLANDDHQPNRTALADVRSSLERMKTASLATA